MINTKTAILKTLIYFDIFSHPLNISELYSLIGIKSDYEEFENSLKELINNKLVLCEYNYLFIVNGSSSVLERIKKLNRSEKFQRISRFISRIIYFHPFVKGVLLSGSLSKSAFKRKEDIDFFVIAEPGRVWICKTILMLFKKIFLLNSKKYFCINYFVDTEVLEIPEKNIFTATEIAFLIPLRNNDLCRKFFEANDWIHSFFPNLNIGMTNCTNDSDPLLKRFLEMLLRINALDRLDTYFMELYRKRTRKKFGIADPQFYEINFKSDKNVAKYHPNGYQNIVLEKYQSKIMEFQISFNINLS
jgi:hypothetical protein